MDDIIAAPLCSSPVCNLHRLTKHVNVVTGGISASTSLIILHQLEDKLKAHSFMLEFLKGVSLWGKVRNVFGILKLFCEASFNKCL